MLAELALRVQTPSGIPFQPTGTTVFDAGAVQGIDIATAALNEGYESPSEISRDYRRLFGQPPARDIARL
jgi:AraC-like DNA-binding protein